MSRLIIKFQWSSNWYFKLAHSSLCITTQIMIDKQVPILARVSFFFGLFSFLLIENENKHIFSLLYNWCWCGVALVIGWQINFIDFPFVCWWPRSHCLAVLNKQVTGA